MNFEPTKQSIFIRPVDNYGTVRIRDADEALTSLLSTNFYVGESVGYGKKGLLDHWVKQDIRSISGQIPSPAEVDSKKAKRFYRDLANLYSNTDWLKDHLVYSIKCRFTENSVHSFDEESPFTKLVNSDAKVYFSFPGVERYEILRGRCISYHRNLQTDAGQWVWLDELRIHIDNEYQGVRVELD